MLELKCLTSYNAIICLYIILSGLTVAYKTEGRKTKIASWQAEVPFDAVGVEVGA